MYGVVKVNAKKVNVNICFGIIQAGLKINKRMINSELVS